MNKREKMLWVGNSNHRHKFKRVEWDRDRLGKNVVDFIGCYATFKHLCQCKCGAERVISFRGLY